jgi:hypothetical protein
VPPLIVGLLINGVAYALIAIALAFVIERIGGPRYARLLVGVGLIVASLFYVYFAARENQSALWNIGELVGVAVFGTLAVLGIRGSRWWLVVGGRFTRSGTWCSTTSFPAAPSRPSAMCSRASASTYSWRLMSRGGARGM